MLVLLPVGFFVIPLVFVMIFVMMFTDEMDGFAHAAGFPAEVEGIDPTLLQAYFMATQRAEEISPGCQGMTWTLVAAIGWVETKHATYSSSDGGSNTGRAIDANGKVSPPIIGIALNGSNNTQAIRDTDEGEYDGDTDWDRAVGPMQFIPGSWEIYGEDGNDDGEKDPQNVFDAAAAAVGHLCESGNNDLTTDSGLRSAIGGYNAGQEYYDKVIERKEHYDSLAFTELAVDPNAECGGRPDRVPTSRWSPTLHPEMCELYIVMATTFGDQGVWLANMTPGGNIGENQENYHCIRPGDDGKHGSGNACDFYVGYPEHNASIVHQESHAKARQVINALIMNNDKYTNLCVIYEQRIWWGKNGHVGDWLSVSTPMEDRGNNTENHYDHIHLSVGGSENMC
ncbi:lytic transglycosylase domain-containing protein [Nocardiopsis ganjiahuensis]|uniref:lytic transglycosylase domain-containing protein n=1 Tax=Nocardiopsis ganjiahuensis TaxID=239984 RepID=UPI00036FC587|nr:transglycosylase SLT domain-containing protein [Nocardiopsis ganjiahuensis]